MSELFAESEAAAPVPAKSFPRDMIETVLVCVIFVVFTRSFAFQQSKIPSGSMMDTLLVGDYIMVNRFVFAPVSFDWERHLLPIRPIRRGDIVVFKQPNEPEIDFIKRVVGLPGETVELREGRLHVEGVPIDEPYIEETYRNADALKNFGPVTVEEDHYLVFGDHRDESMDSRVWGQVPRDLMKGRALLIWWSFEEASSGTYVPLERRIRSWGDKVLRFLPGSRWERCFQVIR